MPVAVAIPERVKYAGESRLYTFDYTTWPEFLTDPITGATVAATAGVTVGATVIGDGGRRAQARISGGTAGNDYTITCTCTTAGGDTVIGQGVLRVV